MSFTSPSADPLIELRNVHFGYGAQPVLCGLSLSVPRGKVTAIMGASGGGKTTVLRLIGGQQRAQQGEVLFDGQDVGRMEMAQLYAARRRMGEAARATVEEAYSLDKAAPRMAAELESMA